MAFRFESLDVWRCALEYSDACFVIADKLPHNVQFSIGDQLRRAATSILANIAEGSAKSTTRSERNFYDIARGSVAETTGLLALCHRRTYLSDDHQQRMHNRANLISAMLWGLIKANTTITAKESEPLYHTSHSDSLDDIFAAPSEFPISSPPRRIASSHHYSTVGNQITKREIRTLSLAELALQPGEVLWDIGAGSGAVGIEAALGQPTATVFAIEKRDELCRHLQENLSRFPAPNLYWSQGTAPDDISDWPDPHAVFIGGSGGHLREIIQLARQRLHPGGRLVINLATLENLMTVRQTLPQADLIQAQINRATLILDMTRLTALNPVFIATWHKVMSDEQ